MEAFLLKGGNPIQVIMRCLAHYDDWATLSSDDSLPKNQYEIGRGLFNDTQSYCINTVSKFSRPSLSIITN